LERPASARYASYGALESAEARSAKAEAECGFGTAYKQTPDFRPLAGASIRATATAGITGGAD